jgi:hypothetical protein
VAAAGFSGSQSVSNVRAAAPRVVVIFIQAFPVGGKNKYGNTIYMPAINKCNKNNKLIFFLGFLPPSGADAVDRCLY